MSSINLPRRGQIALVSLGFTWLGLWGSWIPDATASLNQNVFYLAEWSTFLTDVRFGNLRLAPDILRLSVALGITALMVSAHIIADLKLRWLIRAAASFPIILILLPPYPDVLQMWWSQSYGLRFASACLLGLGFIATLFIDRSTLSLRRAVGAALCLLALIASTGGFLLLLQPYQVHYARPLPPGWGLIVFSGGLLAAASMQGLPGEPRTGTGSSPSQNKTGPIAGPSARQLSD